MCVYFVSPAAEYQLLCGNQAPGFIIDIHTGKTHRWVARNISLKHKLCVSAFIQTARLYSPQISTSVARSQESVRTASASTNRQFPLRVSHGLQLQQHPAHLWRYRRTTASVLKIAVVFLDLRCLFTTDIDECNSGDNLCQRNANCINIPAATAASVRPDSSCRPAEPASVSPAPGFTASAAV